VKIGQLTDRQHWDNIRWSSCQYFQSCCLIPCGKRVGWEMPNRQDCKTAMDGAEVMYVCVSVSLYDCLGLRVHRGKV